MATVVVNAAAYGQFTDALVAAYYERNCPTIKRLVQAECPVDHGLLRQQHSVDKPVRAGAGSWLIRFRAHPYYGVYVHEGRRTVYPVHAKVLRWRAKGGALVFSMKSRAVAANPWIMRGFLNAGLGNVRRVRR